MPAVLRIAMVSRADGSASGAGAVADFLATELRTRGHIVDRYLKHAPAVAPPGDVIALNRIPGDAYIRNAVAWDYSGVQLVRTVAQRAYDVVHVHDPSVSFGIEAIRHTANHAPVVVTFHDDSGFTGGCLFTDDCTRYEDECGSCPQRGKWPLVLPIDTTRATHRASQRLARSPGVTAVSTSRLFAAKASRGAWRNRAISVVYNPVDDRVFSPRLRSRGRDRLRLGPNTRAILLVAANLDMPEKGLPDLAHAFMQLAVEPTDWHLILAGRLTHLPRPLADLSERITVVGLVHDRHVLAETYAAADVLAVPSLGRDQTPCTISESLSCGTPVVAYDVAAISEMFPSEYGRLVVKGDTDGLAVAIRDVVEGPTRVNRDAAHRFAVETYGAAKVTDRYEQLYGATAEKWKLWAAGHATGAP